MEHDCHEGQHQHLREGPASDMDHVKWTSSRSITNGSYNTVNTITFSAYYDDSDLRNKREGLATYILLLLNKF
ncbi:hypothetical protein ANCDUO_18149 [Ancylostoma duodenale]|uniref:Uncharacterized protein n=1 Tax=Ancylostoma duodenale TaxID=51022 RepID=A0A0C2C637_9BILA|nr:hypothetical protein ANCDUO_18149 [Ancylostoma duodenale]